MWSVIFHVCNKINMRTCVIEFEKSETEHNLFVRLYENMNKMYDGLNQDGADMLDFSFSNKNSMSFS